jgi:phosphoglycerate dehydrogenase-like enzyme
MTVVFQNFHTHPDRRAAAQAEYAAHGLCLVDDPQRPEARQAQWVLTKTRYIDDAFAARFPALRGIVVLGTESWMVDLRSAAGLAVVTLEEDRGYEVAEHALALMLAGIKRLPSAGVIRRRLSPGGLLSLVTAPPADETRGAHNWAGRVSDTLYRQRVGIVGYGLIGREIHRRLAGFGADVLYHHRSRYPEAVERRLGMRYAALEELFGACDAIFVQLPLSPGTRGLVSGAVLARARPNLVLINCGRAAVVDEDALYAALKRRSIAFYAADVFWREPMPYFDRFRRLDNCLITPHMAESLPERKHDMLRQAVAKIVELSESTHD